MVGRPELLAERPELASVYDAADRLFPVRVTRSFWTRARVVEALARQVLPGAAELVASEGDLDDPVGDRARSPVPWVVHKYPDRVLLLMTKRCHLYCRYCFRRTFEPAEAEDPTDEAWQHALVYATGCGAREAILSGGDPLAVRDARIFDTIDALKQGGIRVIRIHTRAPITAPHRVTPELVAGLAERGPVWVTVHANHPAELSADVDEALGRMVDAGIPVLNQAVLLRGVNDDVEVLAALSEALVERRVRPYYLHHTDAVTGNADFRVEATRGLEIYEALRRRVSGVGLPRYVVDPPEGGGKLDVERWVRGQAR